MIDKREYSSVENQTHSTREIGSLPPENITMSTGLLAGLNASANEDVPDTAILGIISSRGTMLAVRTLAMGKDLTLTLIDHETEPLAYPLRLRLNGDPNFAQLYERLRRTV